MYNAFNCYYSVHENFITHNSALFKDDEPLNVAINVNLMFNCTVRGTLSVKISLANYIEKY